MDVTEALDREEIVERAEAVRFWLLGFSLSNRASGAIQRELGAIIADDPGTNGRPLAGLSVADFVGELHSPNGGAVGRVKSVGDAVLNDLRKAIPADTRVAAPALEAAAPIEAATEAPWAEYELPQEEAPRRRGRPKGSGKAAQHGAAAAQEAPAPAQELTEAPATSMAAPRDADPVFEQLIRLWPSLHPHARRAVVLYAGDLLIEA